MGLILYRGPLGDEEENIDCNFIKKLIFNKEPDYWKKGGGDSCIEVDGLDERLIIFYDEPYGYFIMRHPDYLAPYDKNVEIVVVEHRVGGEPIRIPSCCYVSRERAFEILCEFVTTMRIPDSVNWTDIYEIDFDHGY